MSTDSKIEQEQTPAQVQIQAELLFDTQSLLESICPKSLLLIGAPIKNIADEYLKQCDSIHQNCHIEKIDTKANINDSVFNQRYELAIVANLLESTSRTHAQQVLAKLRNLCAPQIILMFMHNQDGEHPNSETWSRNDILALGFNLFANYEDHDGRIKASLYQYNLDNYKKTPDWFNSKHWANPDLWDKYFW
jgi:hypothetical protein